MKLSREKYLKSLDASGYTPNFRWMDIDTTLAEQHSDEWLLSAMCYAVHPNLSCAGLVAELCKRFNRTERTET